MRSIYDFLDTVNEKMERRVFEMNSVMCSNAAIGLDERCGRVFIDEECIVVSKYNDPRLQYYGGFEYVDKEFRQVIGDYVVYLNGDERVLGHIERYYEKQEAETEL
jgi:hypothetical protein